MLTSFVRGRNSKKMRHLLCILLVGMSLSVSAQHNIPELQNNGNAVEKTNVISDTVKVVQPETEGIQIKEESYGRKAKGNTEKKQAAVPVMKSESVKEISVDEDIEKLDTPAAASSQMKQQFESNQISSSRQYNRRSASTLEQMNMDASVEYYKKILPNSFESHFYAYLAGHYNTQLYPELQSAAAMQPENPEVKKQLAAYHIITENKDAAVGEISGLIDDGVVSAGQLIYASDLLVSGDTNAVIVLHGFEDMFATYYVQNNNNIRPDVKLLSLDFMQSEQYRTNWTNQQLQLPESESVDTAYLADLCRLNTVIPLQLSMTIPKDYFQGIKSNLYPVGLTFRYSGQPLDNFTVNERLWNTAMNKKLVDQTFNDSGDEWCTNYLPMLITLRQQLLSKGRKKEAEQIGQAILAIGARTNTTEKVKKYVR